MQKDLNGNELKKTVEAKDKRVGQDQIYDLLVSRELSWQAIILELIRTEQLNPWDIDLALLANKYLETIQKLEELEEGTFHVSSKILLAAAILLRMKSQILHENIKDIDELLFESKKKLRDELVKNPQIITIDEDDVPIIMPRTPLPRARKVTLQELMSALDKAINTEHRRIKKTFSMNRARHAIDLAIFPRFTFNLTKRIQNLFQRIKDFFSRSKEKLTFSQLAPESDKIEKIGVFLPLVHLDHQQKVWLNQKEAFGDIEVILRKKGEQLPEEIEFFKDLKEEKEIPKEVKEIPENSDTDDVDVEEEQESAQKETSDTESL
jgi:segregation and condensation protein A